ncbi:MAG: class I SAM-dependent methyltransferase [Acidobacteria bacterium]|nr:MAG: class I SAM-dependent methyltransferase [Acidobacteriota bacterium]
MDNMELIRDCASDATSRVEMWSGFLRRKNIETFLEIGVYRGDFAKAILSGRHRLSKYFMIDPWRKLERWNKPMNVSDSEFESYRREALEKTAFAQDIRHVLQGTTAEVIEQIEQESVDFAYIDGDHTLNGITVDLQLVYPRIRDGGWIAGDDFCSAIWQHSSCYEPTFVFPYAVYFAEATSSRIYALPHNQFLMQKDSAGKHEFIDLVGTYGDIAVGKRLLEPNDA